MAKSRRPAKPNLGNVKGTRERVVQKWPAELKRALRVYAAEKGADAQALTIEAVQQFLRRKGVTVE